MKTIGAIKSTSIMMILKFWKSILWAAIIAFLLLVPGDMLPKKNLINVPHIDKVIHFSLFMFFELLLLSEGKVWINSSFIRTLKFTGYAIAYAVLTEFLQYRIGLSRHGDWYDILADITGIAAGFILFFIVKKFTIRVSPRI